VKLSFFKIPASCTSLVKSEQLPPVEDVKKVERRLNNEKKKRLRKFKRKTKRNKKFNRSRF
jgi:hypothetical protein